MVQWLSKTTICGLALTVALSGNAQPVTGSHGNEDYKDPKTHEKFKKRRVTVASWQIHKLQQGALVVRLKTSQNLLDELKKKGDHELAEQKEVEQYLINKNIVRSYLDHYKFSKVYFMYSHFSDSLLKGARQGIFLDSNLNANPSIRLNEDFYLLAERDYVYNSSIGFLPEDSAKVVIESGNPTREMAVVVKDKYNHQLKGPFPYYVQDKTYTKASTPVPVQIDYKGKRHAVAIGKQHTYEKFSEYVQQFNENLRQFHASNPMPASGPDYEDARPFLY